MGLVVSSKKSGLSYFSGKTRGLRALGWHGRWGATGSTDRCPSELAACPLVPRAPSSSFVHPGPARCWQALGRELSFEEQNGFLLSPNPVRTRSCLGRAGGSWFRSRLPGRPGLGSVGLGQGGSEGAVERKEKQLIGETVGRGCGPYRAGSPREAITKCTASAVSPASDVEAPALTSECGSAERSFVEMRSCWGQVSPQSSKTGVLIQRGERQRDPRGEGGHGTMEGVRQLKQG